VLAGGAGWIGPGTLKLLAGSFRATLAVAHGLAPGLAAQPTEMYRVAFSYVVASPGASLVLASLFVAVSQVKINVTNAYAGSIAWSNFFSRLTHYHPGRVVWLIFNIAIALALMELGVYEAIERTLGIYSDIAAAWVGALVADLVVNKPLGLSPLHIEFKRAHLYDINPVGVGAMLLALAAARHAQAGLLGDAAQAFSPFLAFAAAFAAAPLIALATGGRFYLARKPRRHWAKSGALRCVICEHAFEPEDMAFCPAYSGAICSLCCSLDARCHDSCKPPGARGVNQITGLLGAALPQAARTALASPPGRFFATFALLAAAIGVVLLGIYLQTAGHLAVDRGVVAHAFWTTFLILLLIAAIAAWLLVLALASRRVAEQESSRQTGLLMSEIRAHRRTDAALQQAKEAAEAANLAKSRFVVGISHELRTPLNAILGYAQLLERREAPDARWRDGIRIIRRSAEHLAGLIEGLLDISKIEAGRIEIYRDEVRLGEFLDQIVNMFRLQAEAKGIGFVFNCPDTLPEIVYTDERRLRQILINLLSNAIKFTNSGEVSLSLRWRNQVAEFDVRDTGPGISEADLGRIFEPFQRVAGAAAPGIGLGLTITKLLTQIMGGDITVVSTEGQGSRFRVRLMLSEVSQRQRIAPPRISIGGYAGRRLTVLVVDDDPVHRAMMEEMLIPLGFTLFGVGDGATCLDLARSCRPDLFLIDIAMPGMDGWELARQLRAEGHDHAAILIVSANAGELRGAGEPGGGAEHRHHDDVIAKPVAMGQLLDKIGEAMRLEWLPENTAKLPDQSVTPPVALPLAALAELRRLGSIGYVRGIRARLAELADAEPEARDYIAYLSACIAELRLQAFMTALDQAALDQVPAGQPAAGP
jgi:signal transduction histidine kinase/FixJ family two-component response regulator